MSHSHLLDEETEWHFHKSVRKCLNILEKQYVSFTNESADVRKPLGLLARN
jgi:hypothetical protein